MPLSYNDLIEMLKAAHNKKCIYCNCTFLAYSEGEEVCRSEECQDILNEYYLTMVYGPRS